MSTTVSSDTSAGRAKRPVTRTVVSLAEKFGLLIGIGLLILIFGALRPDTFLTWGNISGMLGSQAILAVVALALIIPLTANDFDLSVANVVVLSSVIVAVMNARMDISLGIAIPVALASGLVVGAVNGFVITYFRIHSLIVTVGSGTFVMGVAVWLSGAQTISGVDFALMNWVILTRFLGIPVVFFYALGLAAILWYVFDRTAIGRRLLFVGRGKEVARLSGIDTDRIRMGAMIASGFLGAIGGVLYCGTQGAADPSSGAALQLPAFAAAFLGSTAINPGRFNPWGTLIAVYFLVVGITGLIFLGLGSHVQSMFYGGALLIAVILSQLVRGRVEQQF